MSNIILVAAFSVEYVVSVFQNRILVFFSPGRYSGMGWIL